MSIQNKAVMSRTCAEVWNGRNFAVADEVVASDFVGHAPPDEIHGPDGYKAYFAGLRDAFPDLVFTIEEQISEGDKVVTRWSATGTHRGEFSGIPPSNTEIAISGISIDRISGGMSIECWTNLDQFGLLRQLGMLPAPPALQHV
jgi:steroid delta-isomerase-like uncharacterized protein